MSPLRQLPALSLLLIAAAGAEVDFAREVAPILRAYCAGCHNDQDLEGDLSVETHAQLIAGGSKRAVRPGDAESSYLIKVLEGRTKLTMPPEDEPAPAAGDIALLRRWVDDGAKPPAEDVSILSSLVVPEIASSATVDPVTAVAYSPDGNTLALARFGEIELRSGGGMRRLGGMPGKVSSVAFSPEGKLLLAGGGITGLKGVAMIWDLGDEAAPPRVIDAGRDLLYDAEFSPDGALIATAGYDRVVRLWDARSGALVRAIDGHKGAVFDLAFHPSGEALASASADETVKLWRVADGLRLDTLTGPAGEQFSVAFVDGGNYLLAGGADNRIRVWRMLAFDAPRIQPLLHARFAHEGAVERIAVTGAGTHLVSAADDRSLKLWLLPELVQMDAYETQADTVTALAGAPGAGEFSVFRMDGSEHTYPVREAGDGRATVATVPAAATKLPDDPRQPAKFAESEPNDDPAAANPLAVPAVVSGAIASAGDRDLYQFTATAGERLVFEIDAARSKSKLDSKIEVLRPDGSPLERVVLQAVRDSWITFRGKDSNTSDDFRVHNWREMELNEYLYVGGEVVKLWHYPRGPDSGFKVYPGSGNRWSYFDTTPVAHALGAPCYIVSAHPAGSEPAPNGLPVYRLYYENDDDPQRRLGSDSRMVFTAPAVGQYLLRVSDVRDFGASDGFGYTLTARHPRPGFSVKVGGKDPKLAPGTGKVLTFTAEREDGFDGAIRIDIGGSPEGYTMTTPVIIGAGQERAFGSIFASAGAAALEPEAAAAIQLTATADVDGAQVRKPLGDLGKVELAGEAKLTVAVRPLGDRTEELVVHPGETVYAVVNIERRDFGGRVEFGNDDSGRSMPHGVYVDNIGLNGLMIVEGQSEREFAITAAPWVQPGEGWLFLNTGADGGRASPPLRLRVVAR